MKESAEEIMIDYMEMEMCDQDRKIMAGELRGSAKLRRYLGDMMGVRFEIQNTQSNIDEVDMNQLHRNIMTQIDLLNVKKN